MKIEEFKSFCITTLAILCTILLFMFIAEVTGSDEMKSQNIRMKSEITHLETDLALNKTILNKIQSMYTITNVVIDLEDFIKISKEISNNGHS